MKVDQRNYALLAVVAVLAILAGGVSGCGKDKSDSGNDDKKDESGEKGGDDTGGGGDAPGSEDALRKDEYQGVYKVASQLETSFLDCTTEPKPVKGMGELTYFKLDTVFEFTMEPTEEPKLDLWLYECENESACVGQVVNFYFPEKTEKNWGGITSMGVGDSAFEPGKCSFSYTERTAVLTGKDLEIVTTSYMGDVAPVGAGCMSDDGGAGLDAYMAAYKGKVECSGIETIKATKLDVPMPK